MNAQLLFFPAPSKHWPWEMNEQSPVRGVRQTPASPSQCRGGLMAGCDLSGHQMTHTAHLPQASLYLCVPSLAPSLPHRVILGESAVTFQRRPLCRKWGLGTLRIVFFVSASLISATILIVSCLPLEVGEAVQPLAAWSRKERGIGRSGPLHYQEQQQRPQELVPHLQGFAG